MGIDEEMNKPGDKGSDRCVVALTADTILGLTGRATTQGPFEQTEATHSHDKKDTKDATYEMKGSSKKVVVDNVVRLLEEQDQYEEERKSAQIREKHKQASTDDNSSAASEQDQPALERCGHTPPLYPGAVWVDGINAGNASTSPNDLLDEYGEDEEAHITPLNADELRNEVLSHVGVEPTDIRKEIPEDANNQTKCRTRSFFVVLIVLSAALATILILVRSNKSDNSASETSQPFLDPFQDADIFAVIEEECDTLYSEHQQNPLQNRSSIQFQAFSWLDLNIRDMNIDWTEMSTDWILTNYILYILYMSLNGPEWNYSLKGSDHLSSGTAPWVASVEDARLDFCSYFMRFTVPSDLSGGIVAEEIQACDETGNLITITLDAMGNLAGNLPEELGLLTNLQYIALFDNTITGTLPTTLGLLTNLRMFSVRSNQMTGILPTELGLMTNLGECLESLLM